MKREDQAELPDVTLTETLSEEERLAVQVRLWDLLGRYAARYTMGDSSSIPVETAQELFLSVCFTLSEALRANGRSPKLLLSADLEALLSEGQRAITGKLTEGRALWEDACRGVPSVESESLRDTLREIGGFFRRYDRYFFAHRIPCGIDYPLCLPVRETCLGVNYIMEYLRRVILENRFLRAFDAEAVKRLLERNCPDYLELALNCAEPVIVNALGLLLIGKSPFALHVADADRAAIAARLKPLADADRRAALSGAAGTLCGAAGCSGADRKRYVTQVALELDPRLAAALKAGDLTGVFLPLA